MSVPSSGSGRRGEAEEFLGGRWPDRLDAVPASQLLVFVSGGYTQARFGQVDFRHRGQRRSDRLFVWRSTRIRAGSSAPATNTASASCRACSGRPSIASPTTARSSVARSTRRCSNWSFGRIAQIRPHRSQRTGLALQLRRRRRPRTLLTARALPVKAPALVGRLQLDRLLCRRRRRLRHVQSGSQVSLPTAFPSAGPTTSAAAAGSAPCRSAATTRSARTSSSAPSPTTISAASKAIGRIASGQPGLGGEEKLKKSWAAGGRIGWLPFNQLLVYVSGGYTASAVRRHQSRFRSQWCAVPVSSIGKHTYSGWFIGTGYEYGLELAPGPVLEDRISLRRLRHGAGAGSSPARPCRANLIDQHKYVQTVRSELVWRFNFGGPVVARY